MQHQSIEESTEYVKVPPGALSHVNHCKPDWQIQLKTLNSKNNYMFHEFTNHPVW